MEVNNPDETLLTFTDKEKYVNQHIDLADTSVLCKELNRRKEIGDDFFVVATEGKLVNYGKESIYPHRFQAMVR